MIPTLRTERLLLDAFLPSDAALVQRYAGEWEVARFTQFIPHPYLDGMAEEWIATHAPAFAAGTNLALAIRTAADGALCGAIALALHRAEEKGVLGYWLGKPFWGQGYAAEAARAVIAHGFAALGLKTVSAHHMACNGASGRVMEKAGMRRVGEGRGPCRDGQVGDLVQYEIRKT